MPPTLYVIASSPPSRAVLMTAESIGLDLEVKEVDLMNGEHRSPWFLKINPQHTVPTLVDHDGFIVWDSHAINAYMISKYAKDDTLYPRDLKRRALIDQRLYFDSGVSWAKIRQILKPDVYLLKKAIKEKYLKDILKIYGFVEIFLDGGKWIAGDSVTIADYSFMATMTSLDWIATIDGIKYPKLRAWMKNFDSLPVAKTNKKGLQNFITFMDDLELKTKI